MAKTRMSLVHEIAAALRLKANAEILKCTDNGTDTVLRLRTDDMFIDVKVKTYDFEKQKKTAYPLGNGKSSLKDSTV